MNPKHDLIDQVFGDWTVLRLSEYRSSSDRDNYWDCRCVCGLVKPVRACYLKGGHSKRCTTCAHDKQKVRGRAIPVGYWQNLVRNATKRGIPFLITQEDVERRLSSQNSRCALSGLPVMFAGTSSEHNKGKTTASVDRKDPNAGYVKDNIQIVHKTINFMKHTLSDDEFVFLCKAVAIHERDRPRSFIDHHVNPNTSEETD